MLTREQLIDYVDKNYGSYLMEYQKTTLWEFYKALMTNKDFVFIHGRGNGKIFTYKIIKELLEYEEQIKDK